MVACILGVAERLQHDVEHAIVSLRKVTELAPEDDVARIELALALQEAGAIDEARAIYQSVRNVPTEIAERVRWTNALSLPAIYVDDAQVDAERMRFADGLRELAAGLKLDTPEQKLRAYHAVCGVAPFHLHYQPRDNTGLQSSFGDLVGRVMAQLAPEFVEKCAMAARAHMAVACALASSAVSSDAARCQRYFNSLLGGLDPQRFDVRALVQRREARWGYRRVGGARRQLPSTSVKMR